MCGNKCLRQWLWHSLVKLCTKKIWKSVNICKSYSKKISGTFFSGHGVVTRVCVTVNLKAELNGLRNTVLGVLDYPAELVPVINRLSFAQCAYLLSVYRLETLRFVSEALWKFSFCSILAIDTSSSAVAKRPRDASCLSVVSFNSVEHSILLLAS